MLHFKHEKYHLLCFYRNRFIIVSDQLDLTATVYHVVNVVVPHSPSITLIRFCCCLSEALHNCILWMHQHWGTFMTISTVFWSCHHFYLLFFCSFGKTHSEKNHGLNSVLHRTKDKGFYVTTCGDTGHRKLVSTGLNK